jgi:hypothetical protein
MSEQFWQQNTISAFHFPYICVLAFLDHFHILKLGINLVGDYKFGLLSIEISKETPISMSDFKWIDQIDKSYS